MSQLEILRSHREPRRTDMKPAAVIPIIVRIVAVVLAAFGPLYGQASDAKAAFEVASIKPSAPYDPTVGQFVRSTGGPGTDDPGLFTCENCSLISLISIAYDMPIYRITAPDWLQTTQFVVSAKVPAGATKEQFRLMMQNMLAERFKLGTHRQQKEMQIYEMVVAKGGPKLKRSAEEAPVKEDAPEPDKKPAPAEEPKLGKDGFPTLPAGYTQAMMNGRARIMYLRQTMDWFATMMSYQVHQPVADATGLTGKYDFALFWAFGDGTRRAGAVSDGDTPLAGTSDNGGPTLFEALQSQLGLRLEQKKGPVEIIVVDHMERVPTEN
jgi:uncharacterized protein (TIGR03435 family)